MPPGRAPPWPQDGKEGPPIRPNLGATVKEEEEEKRPVKRPKLGATVKEEKEEEEDQLQDEEFGRKLAKVVEASNTTDNAVAKIEDSPESELVPALLRRALKAEEIDAEEESWTSPADPQSPCPFEEIDDDEGEQLDRHVSVYVSGIASGSRDGRPRHSSIADPRLPLSAPAARATVAGGTSGSRDGRPSSAPAARATVTVDVEEAVSTAEEWSPLTEDEGPHVKVEEEIVDSWTPRRSIGGQPPIGQRQGHDSAAEPWSLGASEAQPPIGQRHHQQRPGQDLSSVPPPSSLRHHQQRQGHDSAAEPRSLGASEARPPIGQRHHRQRQGKDSRLPHESSTLRWQERGPPVTGPDAQHGLWRGQKFRPTGGRERAGDGQGRWGNRGGRHRDWFTARHAAKRAGREQEFLQQNPKPT